MKRNLNVTYSWCERRITTSGSQQTRLPLQFKSFSIGNALKEKKEEEKKSLFGHSMKRKKNEGDGNAERTETWSRM